MKTRDRILATSLELFNLCGEPNVTTIDIANEMEISPGNLYYHFRNKDEIIFELFQQFEGNINEVLQTDLSPDLEMMDYWMFVHMIFEKIWHSRFLYRDPATILERNEKLQKKFNRILDKKANSCRSIILMMRETGLIKISDGETERLVTNIVITTTYWLNYQHIRHQGQYAEPDDLGMGVHQIMSQISPYLPQAGQEMLEAVAETYLGSETGSF